jgi:hypothetical protein
MSIIFASDKDRQAYIEREARYVARVAAAKFRAMQPPRGPRRDQFVVDADWLAGILAGFAGRMTDVRVE